MASYIKSMTEGKPGKLILTFALPLMAGNVFQQLYTVVDTAVVGKFPGVNALAALGASDWLNRMMLGIIQGFTQGFAILMAQELFLSPDSPPPTSFTAGWKSLPPPMAIPCHLCGAKSGCRHRTGHQLHDDCPEAAVCSRR